MKMAQTVMVDVIVMMAAVTPKQWGLRFRVGRDENCVHSSLSAPNPHFPRCAAAAYQ
jgi:hypothetical protein